MKDGGGGGGEGREREGGVCVCVRESDLKGAEGQTAGRRGGGFGIISPLTTYLPC